ncbi:MAG: CBS domain-containing protein [Desertifilum sp. SIO1I2]|nr:CBS domain-containing protein [Desertifilum sp. SIO1I2]
MSQHPFPLNLTLNQTIGRDPLEVSPETPVIQVLQLMSQIHPDRKIASPSSYALVSQDKQLLGIVTERDFVCLAATGKPLAGMSVAEMMSSPAIALRVTDYQDISSVLNLFEQHQISHLPVVDENNQLLGVITAETLRRKLNIVHLSKLRRVRDAMSDRVIYAPPTASILQLAQLMAHHQTSYIAIAQTATDGTVYPIGTIAERDIVQSQALNLDLANLTAQTLIDRPLRFLHPEESLWAACNLMQQHQIRHCPIIENRHLTQGDNLNPTELYQTVAALQQRLAEKTAQCDRLQQALAISETRYQNSELRLQEVLNSVRAAIICRRLYTPQSWQAEYYSAGCEQVYSYAAQEFITDPNLWSTRIHPEDWQAVVLPCLERLCQHRSDSGTLLLEYRFLHRDQTWHWISETVTFDWDATAHCWMLTTIGLDITERKQVETALRHSETRFRAIFADAPTGMVLSTPQGQIVQVNQSLCQMLDCSESDLQGRSLQDIVAPEDWLQECHRTEQLLAQELSSYRLEKRLMKQNGETIWVSLTAGLLQDPIQGTLYKLGMYENITERRTVERLKDRVISVVSHELRTPLSSIQGSLGLLATGQLGTLNPDGQELLNIAVAEAQRLTRLVNDILDLERLKSGQIHLVKNPHRVTQLIARAVESVRSLFSETQIGIEVSAVPEEIWVDGDRMIQALTNLLSNAIKFSPPQTTISIRVQRVESHFAKHDSGTDRLANREICDLAPFCSCSLLNASSPFILFCISDRGRGIPVEKLSSIFEPFEQVDLTDSHQKDGSGLGLAICKSIIHRHGGEIWVASTVGRGSHFFFTLPLAQTDE